MMASSGRFGKSSLRISHRRRCSSFHVTRRSSSGEDCAWSQQKNVSRQKMMFSEYIQSFLSSSLWSCRRSVGPRLRRHGLSVSCGMAVESARI
ncbi:hypothetical protein IMZ48_40160 [Candidatus Bathyarchaeota archaeon]|nr:hypothetical protein [Candidatus Bathyarchaeota archaeon]